LVLRVDHYPDVTMGVLSSLLNAWVVFVTDHHLALSCLTWGNLRHVKLFHLLTIVDFPISLVLFLPQDDILFALFPEHLLFNFECHLGLILTSDRSDLHALNFMLIDPQTLQVFALSFNSSKLLLLCDVSVIVLNMLFQLNKSYRSVGFLDRS